ncbi:hypothetical protein GH733_008869 [Mirounga leonina]|nr:hypothetical protein GH733_008869 [Mirounga leonina]
MGHAGVLGEWLVSSKQSADEHPESGRVSRSRSFLPPPQMPTEPHGSQVPAHLPDAAPSFQGRSRPRACAEALGLTATVIVPLREALIQIIQGIPDLTRSLRNCVPCEGKSLQRPERQSSVGFSSSTAEQAAGGHCPTAGGGQLWAADLASAPAGSTQPDPCPHRPSCQRAPGGSHGRPERQSGSSAISYDCSEEELMASIEREYCR